MPQRDTENYLEYAEMHRGLLKAPCSTFRRREVSRVEHKGEGLFAGLPSPLLATRYHSLCVREASLPRALRVTARASDGAVRPPAPPRPAP